MEFRVIYRNSVFICIQNLNGNFIQETLDFFIQKTEIKLKTSILHLFTYLTLLVIIYALKNDGVFLN
jgi:hypothetical protein